MNTTNRDTILQSWRDAQVKVTEAVALERELRTQVIAAFSEITEEMYSGTESIDVGWGFDLKIEHKLDYKLDNANDSEKIDALSEKIISLLGDDFGEAVTTRLLKRKFDISVTEYKKLHELPNGEKIKSLVDSVLTIKPAAKAVKLHKRGK